MEWHGGPRVAFVVIMKGFDYTTAEDRRPSGARYTRDAIRGMLQFMGCKPRHAYKAAHLVFQKLEAFASDGRKFSAGSRQLWGVGAHADGSVYVAMPRSEFYELVCSTLTEYNYKYASSSDEIKAACSLKERRRHIIVLLCGTSGSGKSTLASILASRLGISTVLSTDTVRHMMRGFTSPEETPLLFASTYEAGEALRKQQMLDETRTRNHLNQLQHQQQHQQQEHLQLFSLPPQKPQSRGPTPAARSPAARSPAASAAATIMAAAALSAQQVPNPHDLVIRGYKAQCELVSEHLEQLICSFEARRQSLVVEGVHVHVGLVMRLLQMRPGVVPFLVYIKNEAKHVERMAVRAKYMTLDPNKNKYVKNMRNIRWIQDYLFRKAEKHAIPCVENTNIDRSVGLIHLTLLGCLKRMMKGEPVLDSGSSSVRMLHNEYSMVVEALAQTAGVGAGGTAVHAPIPSPQAPAQGLVPMNGTAAAAADASGPVAAEVAEPPAPADAGPFQLESSGSLTTAVAMAHVSGPPRLYSRELAAAGVNTASATAASSSAADGGGAFGEASTLVAASAAAAAAAAVAASGTTSGGSPLDLPAPYHICAEAAALLLSSSPPQQLLQPSQGKGRGKHRNSLLEGPFLAPLQPYSGPLSGTQLAMTGVVPVSPVVPTRSPSSPASRRASAGNGGISTAAVNVSEGGLGMGSNPILPPFVVVRVVKGDESGDGVAAGEGRAQSEAAAVAAMNTTTQPASACTTSVPYTNGTVAGASKSASASLVARVSPWQDVVCTAHLVNNRQVDCSAAGVNSADVSVGSSTMPSTLPPVQMPPSLPLSRPCSSPSSSSIPDANVVSGAATAVSRESGRADGKLRPSQPVLLPANSDTRLDVPQPASRVSVGGEVRLGDELKPVVHSSLAWSPHLHGSGLQKFSGATDKAQDQGQLLSGIQDYAPRAPGATRARQCHEEGEEGEGYAAQGGASALHFESTLILEADSSPTTAAPTTSVSGWFNGAPSQLIPTCPAACFLEGRTSGLDGKEDRTSPRPLPSTSPPRVPADPTHGPTDEMPAATDSTAPSSSPSRGSAQITATSSARLTLSPEQQQQVAAVLPMCMQRLGAGGSRPAAACVDPRSGRLLVPLLRRIEEGREGCDMERSHRTCVAIAEAGGSSTAPSAAADVSADRAASVAVAAAKDAYFRFGDDCPEEVLRAVMESAILDEQMNSVTEQQPQPQQHAEVAATLLEASSPGNGLQKQVQGCRRAQEGGVGRCGQSGEQKVHFLAPAGVQEAAGTAAAGGAARMQSIGSERQQRWQVARGPATGVSAFGGVGAWSAVSAAAFDTPPFLRGSSRQLGQETSSPSHSGYSTDDISCPEAGVGGSGEENGFGDMERAARPSGNSDGGAAVGGGAARRRLTLRRKLPGVTGPGDSDDADGDECGVYGGYGAASPMQEYGSVYESATHDDMDEHGDEEEGAPLGRSHTIIRHLAGALERNRMRASASAAAAAAVVVGAGRLPPPHAHHQAYSHRTSGPPPAASSGAAVRLSVSRRMHLPAEGPLAGSRVLNSHRRDQVPGSQPQLQQHFPPQQQQVPRGHAEAVGAAPRCSVSDSSGRAEWEVSDRGVRAASAAPPGIVLGGVNEQLRQILRAGGGVRAWAGGECDATITPLSQHQSQALIP